jgi:hypothetical protein
MVKFFIDGVENENIAVSVKMSFGLLPILLLRPEDFLQLRRVINQYYHKKVEIKIPAEILKAFGEDGD